LKAEKTLSFLDRDNDDALDFKEFNRFNNRFKKIENGDEIRQCLTEKLGVESEFQTNQEKFDAVDASGDDLVDLAELVADAEAKSQVLFEKIDANADGEVDREELKASLAEAREIASAAKECAEELADEDVIDLLG
jgi:Ca2+-binding EF-hand superfamily protein